MKLEYKVVFGFYPIEELGVYLPKAWVVEYFKGRLRFIKAKAQLSTIASFDIDKNEDGILTLIKQAEKLSIDSIIQQFIFKKSNPSTLAQLLKDSSLRHQIKHNVDKRVERFMDGAKMNQAFLCLEPQRGELIHKKLIQIDKLSFKPILNFNKTTETIEYRLRLQKDNEEFIVQNLNPIIISNSPAYILVDSILYAIKDLSASKLKPFLKKDVVCIPTHLTTTYFKKFVVEMMSRAEVITAGFIVEKYERIIRPIITVKKNYLNNRLGIFLQFEYGLAKYSYRDDSRKTTFLEISDDNEVKVKQVVRSKKEAEFGELFLSLGLQESRSSVFYLNSDKEEVDDLGLLVWLTNNKHQLEVNGFDIANLLVEDKKLTLVSPQLQVSVVLDQDWFDVHGDVVIDSFRIKFSSLGDHILSGNRYYLLSDGSYFIIPLLWMSRFEALFVFGSRTNQSLRLRKNNYTVIRESGFGIEYDLVNQIEVEEINYHPSKTLLADLRPYQLYGVRWLIRHQQNGLGACLADDMGLGKTLQALALLTELKNSMDEIVPDSTLIKGQLDLFIHQQTGKQSRIACLVISPASLVFNWYNEIEKFCPSLSTCQFIGPNRSQYIEQLSSYDIVLTTYHTAMRDIEGLQALEWTYVILDESQMIKNKESKIFKSLSQLTTINKLTLTGTPIENSLSDLWSQMQFINPDILGSFKFFKKQFQIPIEKHGDEEANKRLKKMVEPFILRRTKEQVAPDLPEIIRSVEYVSMSEEQSNMFEKEKSKVRNSLLMLNETDKGFRIHVLNSILKLRQIANHPRLFDENYLASSGKFDLILQKINILLKSNAKVLIFSSFTSHLDIFANEFDTNKWTYCKLTGKTPTKRRQSQVELFQNDKAYPIFLISIKAGGTGLNLTAADYVFILDPWWNPFVEEQAIARAHRIGRLKPVIVYQFISRHSIEEKIIKLQERKRKLSSDILESAASDGLSFEEMKDLIS